MNKRRRPPPSCRCTPKHNNKVRLLQGRGYAGTTNDTRKQIYAASSDEDHSLHHTLHTTNLLGSVGQLCSGFFHHEAATTATNTHRRTLCLDPIHCIRAPTTVVVVKVSSVASSTDFVARYHSCWRGYSNSIHAEQFLINDARLSSRLREEPNSTVDLYMTQQPCHYSTGRYMNRKVTGKTSCTERILKWWMKHQEDVGKSSSSSSSSSSSTAATTTTTTSTVLNVWLANVFRAYDTETTISNLSAKEANVFRERSNNSCEGLLQLLATRNVNVEMIDAKGWNFLFGLSMNTAAATAEGERKNMDDGDDPSINVQELILRRVTLSEGENKFLKQLKLKSSQTFNSNRKRKE